MAAAGERGALARAATLEDALERRVEAFEAHTQSSKARGVSPPPSASEVRNRRID
jgi:hypothetical protein